MIRKLGFIFSLFGLTIFVGVRSPVLAQVQNHPFLLVRSDQYAELQSRANQEPWSGMKTRAIAECTQRSMPAPCNGSLNTFNQYPSIDYNVACIRAIMGACSLAYIVDPANRTAYVNNVVSTLPYWEGVIVVQSGADDGTRNSSNEFYTDATAAAFNTVLTIDIMHADLENRSYTGNIPASNQLQYAEFLMEQEFNHFYGINRPVYNFLTQDDTSIAYHSPSRHPPAREAYMTIWKIYRGTFHQTDSDSQALLFGGMLNNQYLDLDGDGKNIEGYMPEMAARVNSSGTYTEGPGYAYAAWGLDRDERSHLVDILEFTGKDVEFGVDFYTNPVFQAFYEWLYGYASTPFGLMTGFSDTHALRVLSDDGHGSNSWTTSSHIGQASRFSSKAGAYAAWKSRGEPQQGRLLNYLLYLPTTTSDRPQSRIFTSGGAFFISQPVTDHSLYGALWNVTQPTDGSIVFHVRKDINALYLSAYGAPLLMNGGFCGAGDPSGPDSCSGADENGVRSFFSGDYLGARAVSNNTILSNYTIGTNELDPSPDTISTNFGGGIQEGFTSQGLDYASGRSGAFFPNGDHSRNFVMIHPSAINQGYFIVFDQFNDVRQGPINVVFHPNAISRQTVTNLTEYDTTVFRKFFAHPNTGLSLFFGTPPETIEFHRGIIASISGDAIIPEYFLNTYPINGANKNIVTVLFPHDPTHPKAAMSRVMLTGASGATIHHGNNIVDTAIESAGTSIVTYDTISFQGVVSWFRKNGTQLLSYFVKNGRSMNNNDARRMGFTSDNDISLHLDGTNGIIVSTGTQVTFYYPDITGVRLNNQGQSIIGSGNGWVRANVPQGTHTVSLTTAGGPTSTSGPTPTPQRQAVDINGDGIVNTLDQQLVISNYGGASPCGEYVCDVTGDGVVDGFDYTVVVSAFGS